MMKRAWREAWRTVRQAKSEGWRAAIEDSGLWLWPWPRRNIRFVAENWQLVCRAAEALHARDDFCWVPIPQLPERVFTEGIRPEEF